MFAEHFAPIPSPNPQKLSATQVLFTQQPLSHVALNEQEAPLAALAQKSDPGS